mmetsp:Transcript_762/g.1627  ORF Transcript_762/g.1627 Transcript_762/m.1627 type:complete len:253 (-) Transcript_762:117-875(-)
MLSSLLNGPFAGALGARHIQDLVNQIAVCFVVLLPEYVGCDLDEEALELALVPLLEEVLQLWVGQAAHLLQDGIRLSDELHVAVLDAVVHHLDVVAAPARSDVTHARTVIHLCCDFHEDGFDDIPSFLGAARHERGAVAGALLAATHTHTHVPDSFALAECGPPIGVLVPLVAAVNQQIAGLQQGQQGLHRLVHRGTRLDEHDDLAGLLDRLDECAEVFVSVEGQVALLLGPLGGVVHFALRTIPHRYPETL